MCKEIAAELTQRYKKLERAVGRTRKGRAPRFSSLFKTQEGRKFGKGADRLHKFVSKGVYTIFPFQRFAQDLRILYTNPRYKTIITEAGAADADLESIDFIRKHILENLGDAESGHLFDCEDERTFLGSLATSLYAYAERYSLAALEMVVEIPKAETRILENLGNPDLSFSLRDVDRILQDPDSELKQRALSEAKSSSFLNRFRLVRSGLGIWTAIEKSLVSTSLQEYESHFKSFVKLRNKIAHHYPSPTVRKFLNNTYIQNNVENLRKLFEKDIQDLILPDPVFTGFFNCIIDWMRNRLKPFGIILQVTTMATIYPAILDNAIDALVTVG